jgi:pyruvate-formate lyase-activating enzyme
MITKTNTVILGGGGVEYSLEDAAVDIEELIEALEEAKEDGAQFVVMSSGNYRGAKWASLRASTSWADEEE